MCKLRWITQKLSKARMALCEVCERFAGVYTSIKSTKNNYSFFIILTLQSLIFVDIIANFLSRWKENSSGIPAYGIYRSIELFLQPIKLRTISIMMRSWNYWNISCKFIRPRIRYSLLFHFNLLATLLVIVTSRNWAMNLLTGIWCSINKEFILLWLWRHVGTEILTLGNTYITYCGFSENNGYVEYRYLFCCNKNKIPLK